MPAISKAPAAAATEGELPRSVGSHGLNTSNDPNGRERSTADFRYTGRSVYCLALSALASTRATPPSPGEQNMYCVRGFASIGAPSISSSDSGLRRQAFSLSEPLRKALAATLASVLAVMPCSCMYRWIFMPKNCVVSMRPVSPYHLPRP